jgi:hypothetical protein
VPSTLISKLDWLRHSIHSDKGEASILCLALAKTTGSYSHVITRPRPLAFNPSAIQSVLIPVNVPVSSTNSGLTVVTTVRRNSSTSISAVMESYMLQRSGCGHSGVARWYSGWSRSPVRSMWRRILCSCFSFCLKRRFKLRRMQRKYTGVDWSREPFRSASYILEPIAHAV